MRLILSIFSHGIILAPPRGRKVKLCENLWRLELLFLHSLFFTGPLLLVYLLFSKVDKQAQTLPETYDCSHEKGMPPLYQLIRAWVNVGRLVLVIGSDKVRGTKGQGQK